MAKQTSEEVRLQISPEMLRLRRERLLAQALPPLSLMILNLLREHEQLTISELETLTGANKNTLKLRLRELVEAQRAARHGKARATWYTLNPTPGDGSDSY